MNTNDNPKEKPIRTAFYIEKLLLERCDASLRLANCRSRNEFVNNAIRYYLAKLNADNDQDFLAEVIQKMAAATIRGSESRLARLQFKSAVEAAKLAHLLASLTDVDDETLRRLHVRCVDEVKRINGIVTLDDAVHSRQK